MIEQAEREKYSRIWSEVPEYRDYSPGRENVPRFMEVLRPRPGATLIDLGCGTGEGGLAFRDAGLDVTWLDITGAGLHESIPRRHFLRAPLWSHHLPHGYDYGYCCDVMEHIPTEYVMLVLDRIATSCRTTWLQIAFLPDEFGQAIDQTLHLTVKPFAWWLERLKATGEVTEARDICGAGVFVLESKRCTIN